MKERNFSVPTQEEIDQRKRMYEKAEELGIDLLNFDDKRKREAQKSDIRKAVVFLGTGRDIPEELKKRLLERKQKSLDKSGTPD